ARPGVAEARPSGHRGAVGRPDEGLGAVVLQKHRLPTALPPQIGVRWKIGSAVAGDMPARPGIPDTAAANDTRTVQFPEDDFAAAVLKADVGMAVTIVVAGAEGMPARPRIAEAAAPDHCRSVELPERGLAAV